MERTEQDYLNAIQQIDDLMDFTRNNDYENYLKTHLIRIRAEFSRQLTNLTHSSKIKE